MNLQLPPQVQTEEVDWNRVISEANAWRGACMQCFAQAEAAVTDTLLELSQAGERGKDVKLRHLFGQRLDDLCQAICAEGPFATEGKAAFKALTEFREHEGLRPLLAHGVAKIAVERNGKWIIVYRHLSIRSRQADWTVQTLERAEADQLLTDLRRKRQKLTSALENLRKNVTQTTQPAATSLAPPNPAGA